MTHKSQENGSSGHSDSNFNEYDGGNYKCDLPCSISFCILFLSFCHNFNVISLCRFFNVVLFSNVILYFII